VAGVAEEFNDAVSHACTYFDRGYLAQGVALWRSLKRHDPTAELTVLALDDDTATSMTSIAGGQIRVITLVELLAADPRLAAVRAGRSRAEFIFALTPCLLQYVFRIRPEIDRLMYLDADLFFFASPAPIWAELGAQSVLVVPHRFPSWHDDSARYGVFNVGVLAFRRSVESEACLAWWRERCLESTALAAADGRFGDQKYLDEWPQRFAGVVVSRHPGVNLAPWNWASHRIELGEKGVRVDGEPLIVFHFAQFKRVRGPWFDSGQLEYGIMPRRLRSRLYGAYWAALKSAEHAIREVLPGFAVAERGWRASLGAWHLGVLRFFWGQFWLRLGPQWLSGRLGFGRYSGRAMAWYRRQQRRAP
jgi:hypothetical protein